MDAHGNLYGTSPGAVVNAYGNVFEMTPSERRMELSQSVQIQRRQSDGGYPFSTVLVDGSGNLYGTTSQGGVTFHSATEGCGVVWEITP